MVFQLCIQHKTKKINNKTGFGDGIVVFYGNFKKFLCELSQHSHKKNNKREEKQLFLLWACVNTLNTHTFRMWMMEEKKVTK